MVNGGEGGMEWVEGGITESMSAVKGYEKGFLGTSPTLGLPFHSHCVASVPHSWALGFPIPPIPPPTPLRSTRPAVLSC